MPVVDYQVKKIPIQTTIPSSFTEMGQHLAQQNYTIYGFIGELFLWCFSYFWQAAFLGFEGPQWGKSGKDLINRYKKIRRREGEKDWVGRLGKPAIKLEFI